MKRHRKKGYWFKLCTILLLCVFSFVTFSGCLNMGSRIETNDSTSGESGSGGTGGSAGSGSGSSGSSGGSTGSGSTGSGSTGSGSSGSSGTSNKVSANKINEFMMWAIAVYENPNISESTFYDKFSNSNISFKRLMDRQFETMADYILSVLYNFYGSISDKPSEISIDGYGSSQKIGFEKVINNSDQKNFINDIDGKTYYLNYTNAMNGGHRLVVVEDEETGNFSYAYYDANVILNGQTIEIDGVQTTLNDYRWNVVKLFEDNRESFNQESLACALKYIYANFSDVDLTDADSHINFNKNTKLKMTFSNANFIEMASAGKNNQDLDNSIPNIGLSRTFLWNVAYFIAYTLIGSENINNSSDAHDKIFDEIDSEVVFRPLSSDKCSDSDVKAFEKYKGYHIVIPELVENLANLEIENDTLKYDENGYFAKNTNVLETTIFPYNSKDIYKYYDKIEEICDANNVSYFEGDTIPDRSSSSSSSSSASEIGKTVQLKQVILLPYITNEEHKNDAMKFYYLFAGFRPTDEANQNCKIRIFADVMYDYHDNSVDDYDEELVPSILSTGDSNNKVEEYVLNYEYKESGAFAVFGFDLQGDFKDSEWNTGDAVSPSDLYATKSASGAQNRASFIETSDTVTYASEKSRTIKYGIMNANNRIQKLGGGLNFGSNHIVLNIKYYDASGNMFNTALSTNVMWFVPQY